MIPELVFLFVWLYVMCPFFIFGLVFQLKSPETSRSYVACHRDHIAWVVLNALLIAILWPLYIFYFPVKYFYKYEHRSNQIVPV